MIVVCDTNVFVHDTHLLRKKGGLQLERLLRAVNGRLFVPGVLESEYIERTRIAAGEQREKITSAFDKFRSLIGSREEFSLLEDGAIDQRTQDRLNTLKSITQSMPSSQEVLAAAGQRSIEKRRPASATDPAYKDCLIWESVLRLPAGSQVRFVSRDSKAFYKGNEFAPDLVAEAAAKGISVVGYREVDDVVRELQATTPALDLSAAEITDSIETPETHASDSSAFVTISGSSVAPTTAAFIETVPAEGATANASAELAALLATAQQPFDSLDTKVLGFVGYLGPTSKSRLFEVLSEAGVGLEAAKNVAERLVISGLLRDIGNHFLPNDIKAAELAAAVVEPEVINL